MAFFKQGAPAWAEKWIRRILALKISVYASYACYFMILSLFPTLLLLLGILRYTGLSVEALTDAMEGVLPQALMAGAKKFVVSTYHNTSGALVSVSALAALWSSGKGVYGLLAGLNAAYGLTQTGGYLRTRLVSVGYTLLFLLLLPAFLILRIFGRPLREGLPGFLLGAPGLLLALTVVFAAVYSLLPAQKQPFIRSLPGAAVAGVGWLGFSALFSLYVERAWLYTTAYGSVYGVALGMLWFYCCVSILLFGGALNRFLGENT